MFHRSTSSQQGSSLSIDVMFFHMSIMIWAEPIKKASPTCIVQQSSVAPDAVSRPQLPLASAATYSPPALSVASSER